jgi:ABC-2 type transport system permease protein
LNKLRSILRKDVLILVRDIPGLVILFLMPALLIFVVTLAQDRALKNQQEKVNLLFIDTSGSPFSDAVAGALDSSGLFSVVRRISDRKITMTEANEMIRKGTYKFGLQIRHPDSALIFLADPALQESYRESFVSSVRFVISGVQSARVFEEIMMGTPEPVRDAIRQTVQRRLSELPPVEVVFAAKDKSETLPNVIQNNVPGFILFAMFFIVIPLSGSIIAEKNEGSSLRLKTLPVPLASLLSGKVVVYLAVCLLQFALMMAIGKWLFTALFGLPALETGGRPALILTATVAAALAAVGFGMIIGTAASTHNQAALFGSVMVVLLGVISGTFLPVHLLPESLQVISHLSPVRWGIDNYLELFIRDGSLVNILPNTIMLIVFFGLAMIYSITIFAKRI